MTARASVAVVLAVLGVALAAPARAQASCPAYVAPPTPEALARLAMPDGLMIGPRRGRVPLVVRMIWMLPPVADPVRLEIDAGAGTPVWSDTSGAMQHTHTYPQPGNYGLIARVTDRTGRTAMSCGDV